MELLEFDGGEAYCTLNSFRAFGVSAISSLREEVAFSHMEVEQYADLINTIPILHHAVLAEIPLALR